jgi:hypothetical protein
MTLFGPFFDTSILSRFSSRHTPFLTLLFFLSHNRCTSLFSFLKICVLFLYNPTTAKGKKKIHVKTFFLVPSSFFLRLEDFLQKQVSWLLYFLSYFNPMSITCPFLCGLFFFWKKQKATFFQKNDCKKEKNDSKKGEKKRKPFNRKKALYFFKKAEKRYCHRR